MRPYLPLTREFSAIEELQQPYRLTYALDAADGVCRLRLSRSGQADCSDSLVLDASPQRCYALLLYLYENCVQPEIWRDVIEERCPLSRQATPGQGRKDVVPLEG